MEKQQAIVIGRNPMAAAIAARLAEGAYEVLRLGLEGPAPAALPLFNSAPAAVWPLPLQPAASSPQQPVLAADLKLERLADNRLRLTAGERLPETPDLLVIASARAAARLLPQLGLRLPLRPVRCHQLPLTPGAALDDTAHLPRGSIQSFGPPPAILYDGILDPRQATFATAPDTAVAEALNHWLGRRKATAAGPATALATATTPDFLPAFGPWPDLPGLWLAVGWHIWAATLAGSVARRLAAAVAGNPINEVEISRLTPARFQSGAWQPTPRPAWLPEGPQPQLVGGQKEVTRATTVNTVETPTVERMQNVQLTDAPTLQMAGEVRQTERVVTMAGAAPAATPAPRAGKGKVQAAAVRTR
jgi:hypothetical protein